MIQTRFICCNSIHSTSLLINEFSIPSPSSRLSLAISARTPISSQPQRCTTLNWEALYRVYRGTDLWAPGLVSRWHRPRQTCISQHHESVLPPMNTSGRATPLALHSCDCIVCRLDFQGYVKHQLSYQLHFITVRSLGF